MGIALKLQEEINKANVDYNTNLYYNDLIEKYYKDNQISSADRSFLKQVLAMRYSSCSSIVEHKYLSLGDLVMTMLEVAGNSESSDYQIFDRLLSQCSLEDLIYAMQLMTNAQLRLWGARGEGIFKIMREIKDNDLATLDASQKARYIAYASELHKFKLISKIQELHLKGGI